MRTAEERTRLVLEKTAGLRSARRRRRRRVLDACCVAGCLALILGMGSLLAGFEAESGAPVVVGASGTASILASNGALGYILMGLMAFVLGVCATVLVQRLHRRQKVRSSERREDGRQDGLDDEL